MLEQISQVVKRLTAMWAGEVARVPVAKQGPMGKLLGIPGPIEDVTFSNSDPEEYYPIVGTDLGTSDVPEDEMGAAATRYVTELKQEAADLVRARVIEFKVNGFTFTRIVRKADAAAFATLKADIKRAVEEGSLRSTMREILPTLKVRPGFVYA